MGRNGVFRAAKEVPLKKMHEHHGFLHVQELSGCLETPREASGAHFFFVLFSMCLGRLRHAVLEPNFMAQLRTRARFPRSTLEIHRFFSSEMKTGKQMCRTVCVFFLRTLIFSKEMHAQNHFERDVWDEMAVLLPPGAPSWPWIVHRDPLFKSWTLFGN